MSELTLPRPENLRLVKYVDQRSKYWMWVTETNMVVRVFQTREDAFEWFDYHWVPQNGVSK